VGGEEEAGVRIVCVGVCIYVHCVPLSPSQPPRGNCSSSVVFFVCNRDGKCGVGGRAAV